MPNEFMSAIKSLTPVMSTAVSYYNKLVCFVTASNCHLPLLQILNYGKKGKALAYSCTVLSTTIKSLIV